MALRDRSVVDRPTQNKPSHLPCLESSVFSEISNKIGLDAGLINR